MPKKKNQHFVPQFYLRRFSNYNTPTLINLFNTKSQKYITAAPIKHQASKSYFYDKNGFYEDNLEIIEDASAKSISKLSQTNTLKKLTKREILLIRVFTFFQLSRTKAKAEQTQKNINDMHKLIYGDDPQFEGFFDKYEVGYEHPAAFSLSTMSSAIQLTFDLKLKILINGTSQPFITSDNPVLAYNQFLEKRKHHGGITGLGVKGIQYFLPIDEKKCLLFYDDITYNVGSFFKETVLIKSKKDIDQINMMQIMNCTDNVYFNDNSTTDYIDEIYNESLSFEKPGINKVNKYLETTDSNKSQNYLIHSYTTSLKIKLRLSFIKETTAATKYKMGNKAVHVRNEKLFGLMNKHYSH